MNSLRTFKADYLKGTTNENVVLTLIKDYFKTNITKATDTYSKYDFSDDNTLYELKTRNNFKNTYPTTLISQNKILKTDKQQIFLFHFTDGLYYIKYDPEVFKDFAVEEFQRNARADYNDRKALAVFIPNDLLISVK